MIDGKYNKGEIALPGKSKAEKILSFRADQEVQNFVDRDLNKKMRHLTGACLKSACSRKPKLQSRIALSAV